MLDKDWSVRAEENEHGTCVHVIINEDVNIDNVMFYMKDDERRIIANMKVTCREIYMCSSMAKPVFVELGNCVKYVNGSGVDTYKNVTN